MKVWLLPVNLDVNIEGEVRDVVVLGAEKLLRSERSTSCQPDQGEFAEKVGISHWHISEIETGKRVIGRAMARRFAEVLWVDYRALL